MKLSQPYIYSQLSINGHLYNMETCLTQIVVAGPNFVHLRESC